LNEAINIFETPKLLGFTITTMTRHLILSGLRFIVTLYLLDTARGFGLWCEAVVLQAQRLLCF
jgi:hypothetical protein